MPPVQPLTWPLVFFMSRMYMSPRTNSPSSLPSRLYTLGWGEPVTTRKASPVGDQLTCGTAQGFTCFHMQLQTLVVTLLGEPRNN